ncbi:Proline-rich protein 12 [Liparis tanakae]|uniref:Proline-rich protein 12 n=1 Tax=Liparis tanakae TaxID=230148 RepID=A0A4Z2IWD0_9TELE|nr:Proline-rich protein 12 [Liparis tanakae]
MPSSECLLRTDSLSSTEPVLSDGSVGSAPSLGLSPGPSAAMDIGKHEENQTRDMSMKHQQKAVEMTWKKDIDEALSPEAWAAMQKLSTSADEKSFDFKPGFMASFLDFLKTGKKQSHLGPDDGGEQESLNSCSSMKGGIRPLSPSSPPPPPPLSRAPTPPQTFGEGGRADGADLDEELQGNLETLPSFSSDEEEEEVNKNQDLQKSISSAISALYDTPHSLAAAMASAMAKAPHDMESPPPPLSPPLPAVPPLIPSMEDGKEEALTYMQENTRDEEEMERSASPRSIGEHVEEREEPRGGEQEAGGGAEAEDEEEEEEEHLSDLQTLQQGALEEEEEEEERQKRMSEIQVLEVPQVEGNLRVLFFLFF